MKIRFTHFDRHKELIYGITEKTPHLPYSGSLALHTGEKEEAIVQNRKLLQRRYGLEKFHMVLADQTHSDRIVTIETPKDRGWYTRQDAIPDCDALVTPLCGIALGILTADCVPVLLYDPVQKIIGAVHAGWRGSQKEIVAKTVALMKTQYGCNPETILAAIGPSIQVCCYEVSLDVADRFTRYEQVLTPAPNGKAMLDLPSVNQRQLLEEGVLKSNISVSPLCTACQNDRFFSYRAEACSGRFLTFIAR